MHTICDCCGLLHPEDLECELADIVEYQRTLRQLADNRLERISVAIPLSTNSTRDEARQMLGTVLRHSDGEHGASHGCVEAQEAHRCIDLLIGQRNLYKAVINRIANDEDVSCLSGDPTKWPITIAREALGWRHIDGIAYPPGENGQCQ